MVHIGPIPLRTGGLWFSALAASIVSVLQGTALEAAWLLIGVAFIVDVADGVSRFLIDEHGELEISLWKLGTVRFTEEEKSEAESRCRGGRGARSR
jgi:hypothetical protein